MTNEQRTYLRQAVSDARLRVFLKERKSAHNIPRYCKGCNQHVDLYTPGCSHCTWRHSDRRQRRKNGQQPRQTHCSGCGAELANKTEGCRTCMSRHWKRLERKNRASGKPVRDACSWCSGSLDEVTPGCTRCRERAWRRTKKSRINKGLSSVQHAHDN